MDCTPGYLPDTHINLHLLDAAAQLVHEYAHLPAGFLSTLELENGLKDSGFSEGEIAEIMLAADTDKVRGWEGLVCRLVCGRELQAGCQLACATNTHVPLSLSICPCPCPCPCPCCLSVWLPIYWFASEPQTHIPALPRRDTYLPSLKHLTQSPRPLDAQKRFNARTHNSSYNTGCMRIRMLLSVGCSRGNSSIRIL